jgi:hypothetical protein
MKKIILLFLVSVLALSMASKSFAAARSPSNQGRDYVVAEEALSKWCAGVYVDTMEKNVKVENYGTLPMDSSKIMLYAGYEVLPWFSPYVVGGQNSAEIGTSESDDSARFGLGAMFNLMDHEIADPALIEDRLRVNAGVEWSRTSTEYYSDELDWNALDASLTVSVVNDTMGDILLVPESIALFGGLIYSHWGGDVEDADSELGYTVGLEVYCTPSVAFAVSANFLEETGMTASLNIRF